MGMDMRIMVAKSIKELESCDLNDWVEWSDIRDRLDNDLGNLTEFNGVCEVWYARKFYDLLENCFHRYENGSYIRIHKETLADMIKFHSFNPNYFDTFDTLPRLCELYQYFDFLTMNGYGLYFEADW